MSYGHQELMLLQIYPDAHFGSSLKMVIDLYSALNNHQIKMSMVSVTALFVSSSFVANLLVACTIFGFFDGSICVP